MASILYQWVKVHLSFFHKQIDNMNMTVSDYLDCSRKYLPSLWYPRVLRHVVESTQRGRYRGFFGVRGGEINGLRITVNCIQFNQSFPLNEVLTLFEDVFHKILATYFCCFVIHCFLIEIKIQLSLTISMG